MIDFIKFQFKDESKDHFEERLIEIQNYPKNFSNIHFLKPIVIPYDPLDGKDLMYPMKSSLQKMDITVNAKTAYIQNSIHKMYNHRDTGLIHNYNDFTFSQIKDSLQYLYSVFPILEKATITRLEFGFNVNTSISASDIVIKNVKMYKYSEPSRVINGTNSSYKEFSKSNYDIKIYDKQKQYRHLNLPNILRFEVRFKSRELKKLAVRNFNQLSEKKIIRKLFREVLNRFNELQIVDEILTSSANYNKISLYNTPEYWRNLNNYQSRMVHRRNYNQLLIELNLIKIKAELKSLIIEKYIKLINN